MSNVLECHAGTLSNAFTPPLQSWPCHLYDEDDKIICTIPAGEVVRRSRTFVAKYLKLSLLHTSPSYYFPRTVRVNPHDTLVFSLSGTIKRATLHYFQEGKPEQTTIDLTATESKDPDLDRAEAAALSNTYIHQLGRLAQLHVERDSSKEEFYDAFVKSGIKDSVETERLSGKEFDAVKAAPAAARLEGTKSIKEDQAVYDQTGMLVSVVNVSMAATAKRENPAVFDLNDPVQQLKLITLTGNLLINKFLDPKMGPFLTGRSLSSETVKKTFNTATIKLDAIRTIFTSLALPESTLTELLGAVDSFVTSTHDLINKSSDKALENAKLINFFSIQPPASNPDLAHIAKVRMFYVQFSDTTYEWTTGCSSGPSYELKATVWVLDLEFNRRVVELSYDQSRNRILSLADATIEQIGASGTDMSVDPVKVDEASPIGPPPPPNIY